MKEEPYYQWQEKQISKYAFPGRIHGMVGDVEQEVNVNGLTKREYFAAMAMQGLIAGYDKDSKVNGRWIPNIDYRMLADESVAFADELLKQLEK